MNKTVRDILDIVLFAIMFILIQLFFTYVMAAADNWLGGVPFNQALNDIASGDQPKLVVAISVLSSVLTLCLFIKLKWAPVSRHWLKTKPFGVLFWAALLALGSILPSEWIVEQIQFTMPAITEKLFEGVMKEPWGYLAIGLLAPLAEELVFRGAILRTLLKLIDSRWHWAAIAISAIIFGAVHGNLPQFVHASLIGLLLGWMYYRTGSILPGVMFHWVNNTIAYVMFNIMPQMADGKLIDIFHGDHKMMVLSIIFSLFIMIPSIVQLNYRMKKK